MKFATGVNIFLGLFVLVQLSFSSQILKENNHGENGKASEFQKRTNQLIEKILYLVKDYHASIRNIYACLPDQIVQPAREILKQSINCVNEIEKELDDRLITKNDYEKFFVRCLEQDRKKVANLTESIDSTVNLCPKNITEKSYQIDITTILRKAFDINFKRGLKIFRKTIVLGAKESNFKDEDREGLRKEDGCDAEKPELSEGEDAFEVYNLDVPSVEYIENDPFDKEGKEEEFVTTEKSQTETEIQVKMQNRNIKENDESGGVDEMKRQSD